jgi:hypothetical protein
MFFAERAVAYELRKGAQNPPPEFDPERKRDRPWGKAKEGRITVWIYVDTNKQVGDADHLKIFAIVDAANEWFKNA